MDKCRYGRAITGGEDDACAKERLVAAAFVIRQYACMRVLTRCGDDGVICQS
jgi:hypothetical protein